MDKSLRIMKVRRIIGILKDKAAECRAMVRFSSPIYATIVRATSHRESPTQEKHVEAILSACSTSRVRVSPCVAQLKRRLRKTRNWAVALKSLILVHRLLREGDFIVQDQLSVDTFTRGRSYLNLSAFKDTSTALTWHLSSWVRCYARYIDQWLCTCRALGEFLDGRSGDRTTSGMVNAELVRELSALGDLLAVTCECLQGAPRDGQRSSPLVLEALRLVLVDTWQLREEVLVRLQDVRERISGLRPEEAAEFLTAVEKVGTHEEAFGTLMTESPHPVSLAAWEFAHVTERLRNCLVSVRQTLKTASGFKSLIVWKPPGKFTEEKRVYRALSAPESLKNSKKFASSERDNVLPLVLL